MENITIFADIIRVNISFVILGTSPKEYYSMEIISVPLKWDELNN